MKRVNVKNLKKGQIVLVGELDAGKFEVAEVEYNRVEFKNWDKIDMTKGSIIKKLGGEISHQGREGSIYVLNSADIIKINKMKDKIKMLEELEK